MKFKDKTRGGLEKRIYATDGDAPYSIHGAVLLHNGWRPESWTAEGRSRRGAADGHTDLLPLREPSEAAVEAVCNRFGWNKATADVTRAALRAAYEIDFPEGGK